MDIFENEYELLQAIDLLKSQEAQESLIDQEEFLSLEDLNMNQSEFYINPFDIK